MSNSGTSSRCSSSARIATPTFSPSRKPVDEAVWWQPSSPSNWTATFSKPSASEIAAQTRSRSVNVSFDSFRCVETSSRRSSASRFAFARAASCADWIAIAACSETATSTSISSPVGRRPESGSSTERTPRSDPSEARNGTKSASSGCQAEGSSEIEMSGM